MPFRTIREFIKLESSSSIILGISALIGIIIANSPWQDFYHAFLEHSLITNFSIEHSINDGLMSLFFLLVGLEIKREIMIGELNSKNKVMLPAIAAVFGMFFPAMIYYFINRHTPQLLNGWAIPTATDIAFALAILKFLGNRIPLSIKILLTAIAIFDDIGAIIIIAIFYTNQLNYGYLLASAIIFASLCSLNYLRITKAWPYMMLGLLLWFCILQSGIHATIAGVLLAFTIPTTNQTFEHKLHPWVAFLILPLFALANTGIPFHTFSPTLLLSSLPLGIMLGLFIGKQLGIFLALFTAIKWGLAPMPTDSNWKLLYGTALLCGIGFTMSLFIGSLAFSNPNTLNLVRAGVVTGSLLSGLTGYLLLRL